VHETQSGHCFGLGTAILAREQAAPTSAADATAMVMWANGSMQIDLHSLDMQRAYGAG
jgi:hypothetical protein